MQYVKEILEMALKAGLNYNGCDEDGEMILEGNDKEWKAFQEEYDNLESN